MELLIGGESVRKVPKNGVGPLVLIDGIMRKEQYLKILQENLGGVIGNMGLAAEKCIFQQDNDPKHTSHLVKNWLLNQKLQTMKWPPQSPDMNPIENLWSHGACQVCGPSKWHDGVVRENEGRLVLDST